jgi:NTP pyrophosphatase (non-canonical NTP hydrolase)
MQHLTLTNISNANKLSKQLLAQNGWTTQFTIAKKILNRYSSVADNFIVYGITDNLIKSIVDVIIVSQHLINHLNITDDEMARACLAKITRTYARVLKQEYIEQDINTTAKLILNHVKNELGADTGKKIQLCIASEEAGELAKEISKYQRHSLIGDNEKLATDRQNIIEELFDTLYTILYVMLIANITNNDLDKFAAARITEITKETLK